MITGATTYLTLTSKLGHRMLDGSVDLIHGHSLHHRRSIEIYQDKPVLYGGGDFITTMKAFLGTNTSETIPC